MIRLTRLEIAVLSAGLCTFINLYPTQALLPTLAAAGFGRILAGSGCVALVLLVQGAAMTVTWLVWPADPV